MQTVPGLVLCEKSEGTLIVFQQDAAGAQDIAHGGIVQIQLQLFSILFGDWEKVLFVANNNIKSNVIIFFM